MTRSTGRDTKDRMSTLIEIEVEPGEYLNGRETLDGELKSLQIGTLT